MYLQKLSLYLTMSLALSLSVQIAHLAAAAESEGEGVAAQKGEGVIVFSSNRDGAWRIWSVSATGGEPQKLLDHTNADESDVSPLLSGDGKTLYFTSTRGGKLGIWRANGDGSGEATRICDGSQGQLSPDGKLLTFCRDGKIWVRKIDDGAERQVTPDSFKLCSTPDWDPKSERLVFACRWEGDNSLWIVNINDGEPTKLFDRGPACGPSWSPDGSRIVYETETRIFTIAPDGSGNRLTTFFGGIQRFARWSPDGKRLVFNQGPSEKGPWEIYTIQATGGKPTQLTKGASDVNPDWR